MNLSHTIERKKSFLLLNLTLFSEEDLVRPNLRIRVWKKHLSDGTEKQDPALFLLDLKEVKKGESLFTVKLANKILKGIDSIEVGLVEEKVKWHVITNIVL